MFGHGASSLVRGGFQAGLARSLHTLLWVLACLVLVSACGAKARKHSERKRWLAAKGQPPKTRYGETILLPSPSLGMKTKRRDANGKAVRVPCESCHSLAPSLRPRGAAKAPAAKDPASGERSFHRGVHLHHGDLACKSCHKPPRYDSFALSGGRVVGYRDVMRLCGQCHGRQLRDYRHGAHGGMAGYWDLDRGKRIRNACTVCHEPHRPHIDKVLPAPRARYRFLEGPKNNKSNKGGSHGR